MDLLVVALVFVCLAYIATKLPALFRYISFVRAVNKIPGPGGFASITVLYELLRLDPEGRTKWVRKINKQHKDGIWKVWVGVHPLIRVQKPEHVELVLPSTVNITKSKFYEFLGPWLGNGLLTSTGEKWFRDRKMLTPAFHFSILEQFAVVMNEKTDILLDCLEKETQHNQGKAVDVFHFIIRCALDIICETAMGINVHAQEEKTSEYVENLHSYAKALFQRFLVPWGTSDFLYNFTTNGKLLQSTVDAMHRFTEKVIEQRISARKHLNKSVNKEQEQEDAIGKRKRKAFLDLLLDANETAEDAMTLQEIREQVDTFMFEGHDTTAAAASWSLFCIGNSPEYQEKIHKELDEVFGDSTEPATIKQLAELKTLERAIKEGLRIFPSVPEFSRCLKTDVDVGDYIIPKDSNLVISPLFTHRDPNHWPDPHKYDPDRFLPENSTNRHPYSYIPFSAGPRNCIGQKFAYLEEKIIHTAILRKYRLKSVEKIDEARFYTALVLKPCTGINIVFTPKNRT